MSALLCPAPPPPATGLDMEHAGPLALHSRSVASLAGRVCRRLGVDDHQTSVIERAALLHDVGKLAIPRSILDKPGALNEREWTLMRRHPVLGEALLRATSPDPEVELLVRHHHERWDGMGYPDRLVGDEIPLGSRIIAACDAFDAMTSARPYRARRAIAGALAEVAVMAGSQFDPEVATTLVVAMTEEPACLMPLAEAA